VSRRVFKQIVIWGYAILSPFFPMKAFAPEVNLPAKQRHVIRMDFVQHQGGLPKGKPPFLFSDFLYD
jgi:hypothetical protein